MQLEGGFEWVARGIERRRSSAIAGNRKTGAASQFSSFSNLRRPFLKRRPRRHQRQKAEGLAEDRVDNEFDQTVDEFIQLLARLMAARWVQKQTIRNDPGMENKPP